MAATVQCLNMQVAGKEVNKDSHFTCPRSVGRYFNCLRLASLTGHCARSCSRAKKQSICKIPPSLRTSQTYTSAQAEHDWLLVSLRCEQGKSLVIRSVAAEVWRHILITNSRHWMFEGLTWTRDDDQCQCLQTSEAMLGKIITSCPSSQPSFIQIANITIGII